MMTKLLFGASLTAALVIGSPSFAQDKASQNFLKDAIEGNLASNNIQIRVHGLIR